MKSTVSRQQAPPKVSALATRYEFNSADSLDTHVTTDRHDSSADSADASL